MRDREPASPLPRGAQPTQALDEHRVEGERRRVVQQAVQHLVVAGGRHVEELADLGLDLGAGLTTGYRNVDIDGSKDKYKEDYNLRSGLRLFHADAQLRNRKCKLHAPAQHKVLEPRTKARRLLLRQFIDQERDRANATCHEHSALLATLYVPIQFMFGGQGFLTLLRLSQLALSIAEEGLLQIPVGRVIDPQGLLFSGDLTGWSGEDLEANYYQVQLAFGHSRLAAFRLLVEAARGAGGGGGA